MHTCVARCCLRSDTRPLRLPLFRICPRITLRGVVMRAATILLQRMDRSIRRSRLPRTITVHSPVARKKVTRKIAAIPLPRRLQVGDPPRNSLPPGRLCQSSTMLRQRTWIPIRWRLPQSLLRAWPRLLPPQQAQQPSANKKRLALWTRNGRKEMKGRPPSHLSASQACRAGCRSILLL